MKSSGERYAGWPLIIGVVVAVLALTAGPALAALTFSGTSISGDGAVVIDSSSTISIGTSTATGVMIGNGSGATYIKAGQAFNPDGWRDPNEAPIYGSLIVGDDYSHDPSTIFDLSFKGSDNAADYYEPMFVGGDFSGTSSFTNLINVQSYQVPPSDAAGGALGIGVGMNLSTAQAFTGGYAAYFAGGEFRATSVDKFDDYQAYGGEGSTIITERATGFHCEPYSDEGFSGSGYSACLDGGSLDNSPGVHSYFIHDTSLVQSILAGPITVGSSSNPTAGTDVDAEGSGVIRQKPQATAALATCNAGMEGATAAVNNAVTSTLGATVTGSGSFHILAYCDGTNWTVMAK